MLGSNNVFLTASLLAKLSLGVSSDWESAAQATGLRGGKWSSAAFFSVRCLVTMSCRDGHNSQGNGVGDPSPVPLVHICPVHHPFVAFLLS